MDAAGHKRRSEGLHDAIVAVSTAAGRAAIGVVRLTGPGSLELLVVLTRHTLGVRRHPVVRTIVDPVTSEPIDRAIVWFAEAPATYTGEDLVEIHAHGNPLILEAIVEACCHLGARRATPGEFTRRALDHGKLDLAGAEAILAAVEATSRGGALLAARALTGFLGQRVTHLRGEILAIAAIIEAAVDFEDDVDDIEVDRLCSRLVGLQEGFEQMAARVAENGRLLSGADVALLGPVNAGKSTLFNQLMGEDRSIVHETPGTTRDVVSAEREIDGLRIRFHDTAGLRWGAGEVESEGIRRAQSLRERVDLVVYVCDATRPRDGEPQASDLVVFNKADLGGETSGGLAISALCGDGVDELMVRIRENLGASEPGDAVLWTGRQGAAAAAAARHLDRAREQLGIGEFGPAAAEITEALVAVHDILGVDPQRDVLDELFTRFCVGK